MNQYQRWHSEVLERDEYTCQNCGAHTCLDVCHILSRGCYPSLKYSSRNAITLCRTCHHHFHTHPLEWQVFIENRRAEAVLKPWP